MNEPKWICIKDWARNAKGDIVENWEMKRYPPEIRSTCFQLYEKKATQPKQAPKPPQPALRVDPPTIENL